MSDNTTVPFGKYRGRRVEDMLADAEYMTWLQAQPWFRERFGHLMTAKDADAMSRTPVHNKIQTLFLDAAYVRAFLMQSGSIPRNLQRAAADIAKAVKRLDKIIQSAGEAIKKHASSLSVSPDAAPSYVIEKKSWAERVSENERHARDREIVRKKCWEDFLESFPRAGTVGTIETSFEREGADVLIIYEIKYNDFAYSGHREIDARDPELECLAERYRVSIEIKPVVADDYPAVLRQMNRNKSTYLFVDRYEGEGATEAQFVAIFAASGKGVVFKRDVDAAHQAASP